LLARPSSLWRNARLFEKLDAQNKALTEALEQADATRRSCGYISSSPTDLTPVLDAVAERASRTVLCQ